MQNTNPKWWRGQRRVARSWRRVRNGQSRLLPGAGHCHCLDRLMGLAPRRALNGRGRVQQRAAFRLEPSQIHDDTRLPTGKRPQKRDHSRQDAPVSGGHGRVRTLSTPTGQKGNDAAVFKETSRSSGNDDGPTRGETRQMRTNEKQRPDQKSFWVGVAGAAGHPCCATGWRREPVLRQLTRSKPSKKSAAISTPPWRATSTLQR